MNFNEDTMTFTTIKGKNIKFELVSILKVKGKEDKEDFKNKIIEYMNGKNGKKYTKYVKSLQEYQYPFDANIISDKFCDFKINEEEISMKFNLNNNISGVYIWKINNEIAYIGETKNLIKRFNEGYGRITPRNIFQGGQSTNCKMNIVAKKNKDIKIYFFNTDEGKKLEKDLLKNNNEKKTNYWNLYNDRNNVHKRQLLNLHK